MRLRCIRMQSAPEGTHRDGVCSELMRFVARSSPHTAEALQGPPCIPGRTAGVRLSSCRRSASTIKSLFAQRARQDCRVASAHISKPVRERGPAWFRRKTYVISIDHRQVHQRGRLMSDQLDSSVWAYYGAGRDSCAPRLRE